MTWLRRSLGPTVSGLPTTFWWLWVGTLVNRAGAFVLPFLALYLTRSLHFSTAFTGVVLGAYGLGSMLSSIAAGVLADRWGRRPVLLWSQVASAATLVGLGVATGGLAVLLLAGLFGFFSNGARPPFSAMMADIVPPAERVRAFSLNYWAINLGFAVAAILAGLLASTGYLTLFLVDAATTLLFAVLVYLRVPESRPGLELTRGHGAAHLDGAGSAGSMVDVLRDRVFMAFMLLTFGFAVVFMQHMSTLPVQMADDGLRPSEYGVVISLNAVLIVLVTVPLTRWLQRFPTPASLAISGLFVGIGFGATAWAASVPAYAGTVIIWTIGELIGSAIAPAVVADLSPAALRGRYQGALTFTFSLAAMLAPAGGGWVYDHLSGDALWAGCALVSFAMAVGHLLAGPAREHRLAELRSAEREPAAHGVTDAVPVPAAATREEADEAIR